MRYERRNPDDSGMMTSSCDDRVTIRRARLEDKDAVISSCGDVYGGRDYLFALYTDLVSDPTTYPVVAVVNNAVVGFGMTTTFDGGVTVMKRAVRVAEAFRGRGINKMMEEEIDRHTREERPEALYETLANTNKVDHLLDRFISKGYKQIYRKAVLNKLLRMSEVQPVGKLTHPTLDVHEMGPQHLSALFQAESSEPGLFPQARLFNFYLGYRLKIENIPQLLNTRGGAFYSFDASLNNKDQLKQDADQDSLASLARQLKNTDLDSHGESDNMSSNICRNREMGDSNSGLTPADVRRVAMVTFYYWFPTLSGYLYFLDIYVRPELLKSYDHLQQHLQRNLEVARKQCPEKAGILTLTFDSHVSKDMVNTCLAEFGIRDPLPDQEDFQILHERKTGKP